MRLTGMGKLVIFLLALGLGFGAFNFLRQSKAPGGAGNGGFPTVNFPGSSTPSSNNSPEGSGGENSGAGGVEIVLLTSASKKGWVEEEIDKFNAKYSGQYQIRTTFAETREAMHSILNGSKKPVLWSPSNTIWVARLDEVWMQRNSRHIVDMNDSGVFRSYFRTPLVFLTTSAKAGFLKSQLSSANGWQNLRKLCSGQQKAPWGKFRFACADPLSANSGLMTLGAMLFDYGQQSGMSQSFETLAASGGFGGYLQGIKKGIVFDSDAKAGSSALFKAFLSDPGRYDVITAYEANALEAAPTHRSLAVIYPRPTTVSEHAIALLQADWVSAQQAAGAREFMRFLGSEESLRDGLKYHFRPVRASQTTTINREIANSSGQGFQQDYAAAELPPYKALNVANNQWRLIIGG